MLTFHILLQQRVKAVLVILEDNSDRGLWSFAELSPEESEDVLFKEVQNYKPFIAFSHGLFPSSDPSFMIPFVSNSVLSFRFIGDIFRQLHLGLSLFSML